MKNDLNLFRHSIHVPVRYDDIDSLRHVNNKAYLSFLEEARLDYLHRVIGLDIRALRIVHVVARIDIRFRRPSYFTDTMEIHTRCARIGGRSYDLESIILRVPTKTEPEVAARATVTLVSIDPETGKPVPHDPALVAAVEAWEKTPPERRSGTR